jgi:short-subunit dehydrogenase
MLSKFLQEITEIIKMKSIQNKTIIVTGCTGSIGSSVCKMLKSNGARVIGISRSNFPSEENKDFLDSYARHDLSIPLPGETIDKIITRYKRIDYLVHTVGTLIPARLTELTEPEIISVINANLLSTLHVLKAVIPVMKQQGEGHIIVIGSLGGIVPMPYEAVYSAAKFGVRGLCLSLDQELKEYGIEISLISPGPVKTAMLDAEAGNDESVISFIKNPLHPENIAEEILKVIFKPKTEVIIPKAGSSLSLIFNYAPDLFYKAFVLMKKIGMRRLELYKEKYLNKNIVIKTS